MGSGQAPSRGPQSRGPQTDVEARRRLGRYLCLRSVPRSRFGQRIGALVNELKSGWAGDDHGAVGAKFGRTGPGVLTKQPGMLEGKHTDWRSIAERQRAISRVGLEQAPVVPVCVHFFSVSSAFS